MNIIEIAAIVVFFISFYGLITGKKMIKAVVYLVLMQSAVVLFFLGIGFEAGTVPPIGPYLEQADYLPIADPLPQALMITAIIVGVAVTTINITMLMALFRKYQTTDWEEARKKSGETE